MPRLLFVTDGANFFHVDGISPLRFFSRSYFEDKVVPDDQQSQSSEESVHQKRLLVDMEVAKDFFMRSDKRE